MTAKDAIKHTLNSNYFMLKQYLSDLSDADLLVRPAPNANHAAWQLGHLISAEVQLLGMIRGATPAALPAGFAERHSKDAARSESTAGFLKKQEYLDLFDKVRAATLASLDKQSDADLDTTTEGRMKDFAPNYGAVFLLLANHTMMHGGQFTVVRRTLGKPILF
jgi:hypothetical protein